MNLSLLTLTACSALFLIIGEPMTPIGLCSTEYRFCCIYDEFMLQRAYYLLRLFISGFFILTSLKFTLRMITGVRSLDLKSDLLISTLKMLKEFML